jgi:uncharacterized protein DUF3536/glycosyl hydrolase family 57
LTASSSVDSEPSSGTPIALVVHGHFYQPPRENPWTDTLPREPSASPFHDWNARIHAECYRANAFARIHAPDGRIEAIVNNYDRMSFNFGPTLTRWIGRHDPAVLARLRASDAAQARKLGAGGALAQVYAHPILPLCSPVDRRTQVLWGLQDFERRFGRAADGIWLAETAVSPDALGTLIDLGVKFTVVGPEQVDGVRPLVRAASNEQASEPWQPVDRDTLDTGRAYLWRHPDGSGRSITLAVFNGTLSRAVAFGDAAARAESFLDAAEAAGRASNVDGQRLVLCASDGELWGHHKRFADLSLAFASHVEAERRGIKVTNLGAYLARNPPKWEARLVEGPNGEGTAWSCAHGLGRWQRDCGCRMSGDSPSQAWRGPLRRALDLVRDAAAAFYEEAAAELVWDPWGARDAYGAVVDDPPPARDAGLAEFARPELEAGGAPAASRLRHLLEMQRATLLMYASCGWFFDDIAGLESSLVIRIGAHAMDLLEQAGGKPPLADVLDALAEGKSNDPDLGTGADVFRRVVRHRVTASTAIATAAFEALIAPGSAGPAAVPDAFGPEDADLGFDVTLQGRFTQHASGARDGSGTAAAWRRRTGDRADVRFEARFRPPAHLEARVDGDAVALADLPEDAQARLLMSALPSLAGEGGSVANARLLIAAARALPPDGVSVGGLVRRRALAEVLRGLLGDGRFTPAAEALRAADELAELLALPPSAERRAVEERVWELAQRPNPSELLRALARRMGFAIDDPPPPQSPTAAG